MASSALAGGAAFLAASGGSSTGKGDKPTSDAAASGLVSRPADTLKQAKRGGILKDFSNSEPSHLDAMQPLASLNFQAHHVYGTLLR